MANIGILMVSIVLALAVSEWIVRYTSFNGKERKVGALALFNSYDNSYTKQQLGGSTYEGCSWDDTLVPNPYLGFLHRTVAPCKLPLINNLGFPHKTDMPFERDPDYFSILVVGGSVASQFATGAWGGHVWLEDVLNKMYLSPNGKPFRILSGAVGGWKFPTQNIMTLMYGAAIDAVISIDGYNERTSDPIEMPDTNRLMRLGGEGDLSQRLISFRAIRNWRNACLANPILRHSFLALQIMRLGIKLTQIDYSKDSNRLFRVMFDYPKGFPFERHEAWNKERFKYYIRMLNGEAKLLKLPFAHFLQPIPAIKKELTETEKLTPIGVTPERYKTFMDAERELRREGVVTFSLVNIFEHEKGEIYGDEIHCGNDDEGHNPGYEIMANSVATDLAKAWKLKKKTVSQL